jgi:hypothetical protein
MIFVLPSEMVLRKVHVFSPLSSRQNKQDLCTMNLSNIPQIENEADDVFFN